MTLPILGTNKIKCLVCNGDISDPDHKHIYVDTKLLAFFDNMCKNLIQNGCLEIEGNTVYQGHPLLTAGYVWAPVPYDVAFPPTSNEESQPEVQYSGSEDKNVQR